MIDYTYLSSVKFVRRQNHRRLLNLGSHHIIFIFGKYITYPKYLPSTAGSYRLRQGTNFETICLKAYEENRILVVWSLGEPSII